MTNTQHIQVELQSAGTVRRWCLFNLTANQLVEGGFSSREAAQAYLEREYPEAIGPTVGPWAGLTSSK